MPLRLFIVEDETLVRDEIKYLLEAHGQIEVVGEADNALGAICGITLAKKIAADTPETRIVFVTAHESYALEGFELNAVDYVLKPFSAARLVKTVDRLLQEKPAESPPPRASVGNDKIIMKKDKVWKLVDVSDICYFQSQDHMTQAVTANDAYTLNYTLKELESRLSPKKFIRTHKTSSTRLHPRDRPLVQLHLQGSPEGPERGDSRRQELHETVQIHADHLLEHINIEISHRQARDHRKPAPFAGFLPRGAAPRSKSALNDVSTSPRPGGSLREINAGCARFRAVHANVAPSFIPTRYTEYGYPLMQRPAGLCKHKTIQGACHSISNSLRH